MALHLVCDHLDLSYSPILERAATQMLPQCLYLYSMSAALRKPIQPWGLYIASKYSKYLKHMYYIWVDDTVKKSTCENSIWCEVLALL